MSKFDELLDHVVFEHANTDPPEGMERRIALALIAKATPFSTGRRLWLEVAAAAILFGAAGRLVQKRPRPPEAVATPPIRVAMAGAAIGQVPFADRAGLVPDARQGRKRVWIHKPVSASQRQVRIAPLEIDLLSVQPIEIASLASNNSTEKGEVR